MKEPASEDTREAATKGYWIVLATVNDPSRFGRYTSVAGPVIASHGGRVLVRGDITEAVEGVVPGRPYIIEFPSYETALACFKSPDYQNAITLREGAAQFHIIIAKGFQPQMQSQ